MRERIGRPPAYLYAAVEPVPEPLALVDILVRQVHAAGESGHAVNAADLAVVAVVERAGGNGLEAVEGAAAYADGLHAFGVIPRQAHYAGHVVIYEAHIQSLGRLAPEHVEDGVPHDARLDDEKLHEDVLFRLFQLFEHGGEHHIAERVIRGLRLGKARGAGALFKIGGLEPRVLVHGRLIAALAQQRGHGGLVAQIHSAHPLQLPLRDSLLAEEYVERYAKEG